MIFANKQDLPNALSASEVTERLKLSEIKGRKVGFCITNKAQQLTDRLRLPEL